MPTLEDMASATLAGSFRYRSHAKGYGTRPSASLISRRSPIRGGISPLLREIATFPFRSGGCTTSMTYLPVRSAEVMRTRSSSNSLSLPPGALRW